MGRVALFEDRLKYVTATEVILGMIYTARLKLRSQEDKFNLAIL